MTEVVASRVGCRRSRLRAKFIMAWPPNRLSSDADNPNERQSSASVGWRHRFACTTFRWSLVPWIK